MGHMYALSIAWPLSVPSCPTPLPQPTGCQCVPTPQVLAPSGPTSKAALPRLSVPQGAPNPTQGCSHSKLAPFTSWGPYTRERTKEKMGCSEAPVNPEVSGTNCWPTSLEQDREGA